MGVMVTCGLLALVGLVALVRWGGLAAVIPGSEGLAEGRPSPGEVARRYLWYVTVAIGSGIGAGLLMAGAGGRLAMRLLAVTAGHAAQGKKTEADQIVGAITAGGTVGFVIFTALFFGAASGALYLLVRRWLPKGRLGGIAFGGMLLVVGATRLEPLRADNPDFGLVGPGWVALVAFAALVLAHGMLVAALAGRYSRSLPLLSGPRSLVRYAPLILMIPLAPVLFAAVLVGLVVVGASRIAPLVRGAQSERALVAGRVILVAVALVAMPGFLSAVVDIARSHR